MDFEGAIQALAARRIVLEGRSEDAGVVSIRLRYEDDGTRVTYGVAMGMNTFHTEFAEGGPQLSFTFGEDSLPHEQFRRAKADGQVQGNLNVHDTYSMTFVLGGEALEVIGDQRVVITPDDLLVLPQGVLQKNIHEGNTVACTVFLDKGLVLRAWRDLGAEDGRMAALLPRGEGEGPVCALLFPGGMTTARPFLERLAVEFVERPALWLANEPALLSRMAVEMLRANEPVLVDCRLPVQHTVQRVLDYLTRNFATVTLPQVAGHFGYHPTYLSTLLKQQTGRSYVKLLTEYRLDHASELLREGHASVDEVAEACGYRDRTSFYKAFRKRYGCSPRAWSDAGRDAAT